MVKKTKFFRQENSIFVYIYSTKLQAYEMAVLMCRFVIHYFYNKPKIKTRVKWYLFCS